ncbi:Uu.00g083100.m01.CDS01 [Anthostomella pinea]|uniref:Uu.00g083100.m01.CDS01 n=1 Tax=Anthostomella pinea TaxID=933095 RepID=A0AAI8YH63_9PEZI|nr:Uu.00g083100.m01.CDS01 [Anthostomella pinea]
MLPQSILSLAAVGLLSATATGNMLACAMADGNCEYNSDVEHNHPTPPAGPPSGMPSGWSHRPDGPRPTPLNGQQPDVTGGAQPPATTQPPKLLRRWGGGGGGGGPGGPDHEGEGGPPEGFPFSGPHSWGPHSGGPHHHHSKGADEKEFAGGPHSGGPHGGPHSGGPHGGPHSGGPEMPATGGPQPTGGAKATKRFEA